MVEHAGGNNKEGMQFFGMCRDNKLNARASDLPSWSSKGISNFFLQSLSLADLKGPNKGLGHLFMVTAAAPVPLSSNLALIGGNSTKPDSTYCAGIKAAIKRPSLYENIVHSPWPLGLVASTKQGRR